jgi:hypothetical protein
MWYRCSLSYNIKWHYGHATLHHTEHTVRVTMLETCARSLEDKTMCIGKHIYV